MGCIILYAILFLTDACVIIFSKKWTNSKSTWSKYLFRIIMSLMWDSSEYCYYIFLWKKCDIHCLDFVNGTWSGTQYRSGILIFLQHKFIFIACHISFFILKFGSAIYNIKCFLNETQNYWIPTLRARINVNARLFILQKMILLHSLTRAKIRNL